MAFQNRRVILTGMPSGMGVSLQPPRYHQWEDAIEVEIEGLGVVRNRMVIGADQL
jgi:2-keto-4-pentenoate hydratase/2-oxohepta-3-ene-1,7-dioic acid hydratase in catechol pathway